ncbi:tRNA (adenosine(37)-N6)-dimethylallyltransferase MiaA [Branchiibius sp. NY16-3462-2]|uniref:tRNA (adenosine(37)-N6)-dimethylallyltransferase MiaA n=1 Tax=Branchiibius sp. NY16-3462-2 TaxID=1807500 RepID=UPI000791CE30|nr:tRNA (adenosine(37)-N6)-dimethylallyltransferase MiaA [Branchiibius sp. NY16-3462-2]KYH45447.1 tRNA dimethylallyltransferase [Branchiibius sp. NY16-3462-2]
MHDHDNEPAATKSARPDPVVAIVGATATGKSDLAIALANRLGGEVINADASQLYAGMDIGTAKVLPEQRQGIRHHQIDVLSVRDEASVAAYQRAARLDMARIRSRGNVPVLAGGSGLYVRAVLDRFEIPPTDPRVRERYEARLATEGAARLHLELAAADPVAAAQILATNGRRIVRALEVIELTGRLFSATLPRREFHEPAVLIGLRAERPVLDERIATRTQQMWREGLLDEVEFLLEDGLREGRTASRAIGYAQALQQIDGQLAEQEAIEATIAATRRLARRQGSWFAPDRRVHWLDHDAPDLLDRAMDVVRAASATAAD